MTVGQTVQSPMAIYCLTTTCHTIVMPHGALGTITSKPPLLKFTCNSVKMALGTKLLERGRGDKASYNTTIQQYQGFNQGAIKAKTLSTAHQSKGVARKTPVF